MRYLFCLAALVVAGCSQEPASPPSAPAPAAVREPAATARQIAGRAGLVGEQMNLTDARWNGHRVVFADYASGEGDEEETQVVALYPTERGVRQVAVTTGEQEGGSPLVAAIGFANADADSADELIVILTWHVYHAEVSGTLYDIRIFDDPRPEQTALRDLRDVGRMFESGSECECESADGPPEHYAFKTIAAVKAELRRRGF